MISTRPSVARPTVSRDLRPLVPISEGARIYHVIHITTNCRLRRDSPLVRVRRNDRDSNPDHQEWEGAPWTTTPPRLLRCSDDAFRTAARDRFSGRASESAETFALEAGSQRYHGHCRNHAGVTQVYTEFCYFLNSFCTDKFLL